MSATIIDGKAIAARVRAQVAEDVRTFTEQTGRTPGLATVLVGEDPGSLVYVGAKQRACAQAGMTPFDHRLGADVSFEQVSELLSRLNEDPAVSGILLQLPVPEHLDGTDADRHDRSRQGRGRAHAGQRGTARAGTARAAAVHAAGGARAARERGWRAGGRRGGRGGALEPVRQADGAAAARRATRP